MDGLKDLHLALRALADATTLPTKGRTKAATELVARGLARPVGKSKIEITPAGAYAARSIQPEPEQAGVSHG